MGRWLTLGNITASGEASVQTAGAGGTVRLKLELSVRQQLGAKHWSRASVKTGKYYLRVTEAIQ